MTGAGSSWKPTAKQSDWLGQETPSISASWVALGLAVGTMENELPFQSWAIGCSAPAPSVGPPTAMHQDGLLQFTPSRKMSRVLEVSPLTAIDHVKPFHCSASVPKALKATAQTHPSPRKMSNWCS